MKPEIYEEELEKRRQRKQEVKKQEEEIKKPIDTHVGAFGKGGRLTNSNTYSQYIMKNTIKNTMRDEDPREALLARAKEAEENPIFIQNAYLKTQPKTIFNFQQPTADELKLREGQGTLKACI